MSEQTAVEWLFQRFEDGDMYNVEDAQFIKHQALAMEREQKIKFANEYAESGSFYCNGEFAIEKDAEDYYNKINKGGNNE
jgi:hypothetical protein